MNTCVVILTDAEATANRVYLSHPDNEGKFALKAVPPGKYSIGCLSGLASEQDVSPEMFLKVRSSGQSVAVDEKQQLSVSLAPRESGPDRGSGPFSPEHSNHASAFWDFFRTRNLERGFSPFTDSISCGPANIFLLSAPHRHLSQHGGVKTWLAQ